MTNELVTSLLDAVVAGTGVPGDLYAPDAILDATVPMWRFEAHGPDAIAAALSRWFRDPAELTELSRTPLPDGEIIRFTVEWIEGGTPWAAHQVHIVSTSTGRITGQQAWCGGR